MDYWPSIGSIFKTYKDNRKKAWHLSLTDPDPPRRQPESRTTPRSRYERPTPPPRTRRPGTDPLWAFVTLSQLTEFTSCHLIDVNNGLSMYFTIVLTHIVFLPLCAFISSVLIFNSIVYLILIFWLFLVFDSIDLRFCYFCSFVELFGTFLFHSFSDDHN